MGRKAPRKRLACRVMCRPHGCSAEHPNVSRRSAHPSFGVSEAKLQTPGAKMRRGNEEVCVLEIVRPGMEDSESAEKQENTGIGPASACRGEGGYCAERSDTDRTYSCRVMRGLDPRIHLLARSFTKMDGLPGQARQ